MLWRASVHRRTGVRSGEALGLRWEVINFADRQFTVKRQIYSGQLTDTKTDASKRVRPISPELYQALLNHKAIAITVIQRIICSAPALGVR